MLPINVNKSTHSYLDAIFAIAYNAYMDAFAEQIRALRTTLRLSQEELATRLGVSFATVNRWESGKSTPQRAQGTTEPGNRIVRLYIPPEARWGVVSGRTTFDWAADRRPKTLGEQITLTTRSIVRHNPGLAGVIDVVDFNETRNGEREISDKALKDVIETFSDPRYRLGLHDVEPDFLGRCYEYLLRKFAEGSGQSAGEFFTPTEVGFLMAEVLRPRPGEECYDYACGSFGLLVKLQLVCRRLDPMSKVPLRLYGQELQAES